jgi:hypothetical protein
MATCIYCSSIFIDERYDAGYEYCLDERCQKIGLDVSERAFRKIYTPALLHKSNYFWVKKTELKSLNVRSDILEQRD